MVSSSRNLNKKKLIFGAGEYFWGFSHQYIICLACQLCTKMNSSGPEIPVLGVRFFWFLSLTSQPPALLSSFLRYVPKKTPTCGQNVTHEKWVLSKVLNVAGITRGNASPTRVESSKVLDFSQPFDEYQSNSESTKSQGLLEMITCGRSFPKSARWDWTQGDFWLRYQFEGFISNLGVNICLMYIGVVGCGEFGLWEERGPQKRLLELITEVVNLSSLRIVVILILSVGILMLREIQFRNGRKPPKLAQIHSHLTSTTSYDFDSLCLKSITLALSTGRAWASWRDRTRGADDTMPGYRWVGIRWQEL